MSRLDEIGAFFAVVEHGGFSAAARALGMSQPALSRAVDRLEARLGVRLLQRSTRRVHLTEIGATFAADARRALGALEDAERAASDTGTSLRGALRVSAPSAFTRVRLALPTAEWSARHPELQFELLLQDRFVDLSAERVDLAVRIGQLRSSSLVARRVGTARHRLCAAPSYLRGRSSPHTPAMLAQHATVVMRTDAPRVHWPFERDGRREAVVVQPAFVTNDGWTLLAATLSGRGVAVLPDYLADEPLADGRLVLLLPEYSLPAVPISVVFPDARHLKRSAREFIQLLTAVVGAAAAAVPAR